MKIRQLEHCKLNVHSLLMNCISGLLFLKAAQEVDRHQPVHRPQLLDRMCLEH